LLWARIGRRLVRHPLESTSKRCTKAAWHRRLSSPEVRKDFFSIQDIAPTFLDIADTSYPREWKGKSIEPQRGISALAYLQLKADKVHNDDHIFSMEHRRTAFLRKGFYLKDDFSEQQDLTKKHPEKRAELIADWEAYKEDVGVVFLPKLD